MEHHYTSDSPARYLALGDSYTIGEGVAEAERWPVQLVGLLRVAGLHVAEPQLVARTGWTTDELLSALDETRIDTDFDLVSLLIGVNNQYRGRSPAEYRDQFTRLLERAVSHAGGAARRVLVLSIPDWGRTPFAAGRDAGAIGAQIDAFNAIARSVARLRGAGYLDITDATRELGAGPESLVADGLHPSGRIYELWARLALPLAIDALRG